MNDAARKPPPKGKPKTVSAMSRIKLALLDQYAKKGGEKTGNDPYNTTGGPAQDQWRGNARRI